MKFVKIYSLKKCSIFVRRVIVMGQYQLRHNQIKRPNIEDFCGIFSYFCSKHNILGITHLASSARAYIPAASGAAADVPE